jgi:DNA-directed RNA polymerase subunit RPC12/RpoP
MKRKEPMTLAEMAARAASTTSGIACPKCNCRDFRTYKTTRGVSSVFRYKACRHCGHKVLTTSQTSERVVRDIEPDAEPDSFENDIL